MSKKYLHDDNWNNFQLFFASTRISAALTSHAKHRYILIYSFDTRIISHWEDFFSFPTAEGKIYLFITEEIWWIKDFIHNMWIWKGNMSKACRFVIKSAGICSSLLSFLCQFVEEGFLLFYIFCFLKRMYKVSCISDSDLSKDKNIWFPLVVWLSRQREFSFLYRWRRSIGYLLTVSYIEFEIVFKWILFFFDWQNVIFYSPSHRLGMQ